jgi:DNA polymerase-4
VDDRPVLPDRPRKSAGSETTYAQDLAGPEDVEAGIAALADEVWTWCERATAFGRTVTVKVRYSDFRTLTRSRTAAAPIATKAALVSTAIGLVRGVFPLCQRIRLLGVTASGLEVGRERVLESQGAFDFGGPTEPEL